MDLEKVISIVTISGLLQSKPQLFFSCPCHSILVLANVKCGMWQKDIILSRFKKANLIVNKTVVCIFGWLSDHYSII